MKKLVLLVALFMSALTIAQTQVTEVLEKAENFELETTLNESVKPSFTPYISAGVSIGNDNGTESTFSEMSCASIELGVMYENVSFAVVTGLNSFSTANDVGEYFYEGKVAVSAPLGYVDGFALAGVGSFFGRGDVFIEYDLGISKEFKGFGTFVQVSKWNGTMYVTPGISLSL